MSLFPFLIFLFAIIGRLSLEIDNFEGYLLAFVPAEPAQIITSYIQDLLGVGGDGVLSISILFSLWTASRGFHALKQSLNISYGVTETRNFIEMRIIGMFYTFTINLSNSVCPCTTSNGKSIFCFSWALCRSLVC